MFDITRVELSLDSESPTFEDDTVIAEVVHLEFDVEGTCIHAGLEVDCVEDGVASDVTSSFEIAASLSE